jgi:prolipoprotein diacylglyceryl transferase
VETDFSQYILWSVDPVMLRWGGLEIRYYSACVFLAFACGYPLWHFQMVRAGHSALAASRMILPAAAGVLIGGRIAHCYVYAFDDYWSRPLEVFDLSRGGLASHGSLSGLLLVVWLYARRYRYSYVEMMDRLAIPGMLGAAWWRVGNFFNSEIVGREWMGPWGVRFQAFAARNQREWEAVHGPLGWEASPLPRHPAQLYEAGGILIIFMALVAVERRMGGRRPRGLLASLALGLYFPFRFAVEYFKEFQVFGSLVPDPLLHVIHIAPEATLTMGQWLSVPFAAGGIAAVIIALRKSLPPTVLSRIDAGTTSQPLPELSSGTAGRLVKPRRRYRDARGPW